MLSPTSSASQAEVSSKSRRRTGASVSPEVIARTWAARWSASRAASATIVNVGLACPPVGKTKPPATNRSSKPWTLQSASTTPVRGELLIRVVPEAVGL